MRNNRYEIPLQLSQPLLVFELFCENRGLPGQTGLTEREFDRIRTKHDRCACHLPDLIRSANAFDISIRVINGEAMHCGRKAEKWP